MNIMMEGDLKFARHVQQHHSGAKKPRLRHLHESTINFGDAASSYTTTQHQSYCGRSVDGRPLTFHLRDPSFPSQHHTRLDLSISSQPQCRLQTHTQEVHGLKHIPARTNHMAINWARQCSGEAVREITNPQQGQCEYQSTYRTEHTLPETDSSSHQASGTPTQWHQHNILTGEVRQPAGPRKSCRRSRDKQLWAERRWETDFSALRLY
ncbi:uncharacterized protein LOC117832822 [Notolabrus celidotus]|uniref:uncharacterized protein LOC117832822 n=1 Tax=Notolabrus celidotus TaxID=1203425 RepID=UPI00148FABA7|nr:uncharacterized protein LOC117832822 [Notolabrus celidotus]XP_034567998.1 uncharacterized protein LOC117832822 [Notolabrus celidotus]